MSRIILGISGRVRSRGILLLVLAYVSGFGCTPPKPAPLPPEVVSQYASIHSIAILPPQVEVYSVTLGGAKEHLTDQEGEVTKELIDLVSRQFAEQGRTAQATTFGAKESEKSSELFQETWLRESSQYISGNLHQSPPTTAAALSGASLGDEAKNVAHEAGSDGLVLITCHAEQRSGGSIGAELAGKALVGIATAGLFVPPADPAGKIVVDAALIDGKSGKIVWAHSGAGVKMTFVGSVVDKTTLEDLIKRLFATLRQ